MTFTPYLAGRASGTTRKSLEQDAEALAVVDSADRFAQERGNGDDLHLRRKRHRLGFDRVGDEQLHDRAGVEAAHGFIGEDAVCDGGVDFFGAAVDQGSGDLDERATADGEVV